MHFVQRNNYKFGVKDEHWTLKKSPPIFIQIINDISLVFVSGIPNSVLTLAIREWTLQHLSLKFGINKVWYDIHT